MRELICFAGFLQLIQLLDQRILFSFSIRKLLKLGKGLRGGKGGCKKCSGLGVNYTWENPDNCSVCKGNYVGFPHVRLEKVEGKAVVVVKTNQHEKYPLTFAGCRQVGADLYAGGFETYTCSSSVDFPEEIKPSFRGDVRSLINEGFREALHKKEKPKQALIAKMMARCEQPDFQAILTDKEKTAFVELKATFETA